MTATRRLLLVLGCALGLLLVAATFPAADPRLDAPDGESAETGSDWESLTEEPERTSSADQTETDRDGTDSDGTDRNETDSGASLELEPLVDGDLVPGTVATVGVAESDVQGSEYRSVTMLVDGEGVGEARANESASFRVPEGVEEFNVTVAETGDSVMVPVETAVDIAVTGHLVPGETVEVRATVGEYRVGDATIFLDGERYGTTGDDGTAVVELPESAGTVEIGIERGDLDGAYSVEVAAPEIAFTGQALFPDVFFPGIPAHVSVTADGAPVEDATVTVGDRETTTGESGTTWVRLPFDDEVTATATVGAEQTSTAVTDLYLRTTFIVLVVPGLLIGATWTYLRYAPKRYRWEANLTKPILGLAVLLDNFTTVLVNGLVATVSALGTVRLPQPGLPSFRLSWPSLTFPSVGSASLGFPSFGGLVDSLTSPDSASDRSLSSSIRDIVSGSDESDDESADAEEQTGDDEEEPDDEPENWTSHRVELRESWHAFLDQVGVRNRETWTPGEASRYALAAGYPRESVRRLVLLFRDVEYGNAEPTAEDVTEARAAVERVAAHDPEEESK